MLNISEFKLIQNKNVLLDIPELILENGKAIVIKSNFYDINHAFLNVLHGFKTNYKGKIDLTGTYGKKQIKSYLLSGKVKLLENKTVQYHYNMCPKDRKFDLEIYSGLCNLNIHLDKKVKDLTYFNKKLLELSIALGLAPALLMIDKFDLSYYDSTLDVAKKALNRYLENGGCALLVCEPKYKTTNLSYIIRNGILEKDNYEEVIMFPKMKNDSNIEEVADIPQTTTNNIKQVAEIDGFALIDSVDEDKENE